MDYNSISPGLGKGPKNNYNPYTKQKYSPGRDSKVVPIGSLRENT